VKPADFARARGVALRTVERWLRDGELPDAVKDSRGRWSIPADAMRQQPLPGTDMSPSRRDATGPTRADMSPSRRDMSAPISLAAALDGRPAFLTVAEAATFLGIPPGAVLSNRTRFEVERLGGRLMVPARVVRYEAGLLA
jgi:hypothetical protein